MVFRTDDDRIVGIRRADGSNGEFSGIRGGLNG